MPDIKLPAHTFRKRVKGRDYYYYQANRNTDRQGPLIRLPDDPRTPDWWRAYREAAGIDAPPRRLDTFEALVALYQDSTEFRGLAPATRRQYGRHGELFVRCWGPLQVRGLTRAAIIELREEMSETPYEANAVLRSLSAFLSWCEGRDLIAENEARKVRKLKTSGTWEPWSQRSINAAERLLPAYVWAPCAIALYTGQRQGDVLKMAWSHIEAGEIRVIGEKDSKVRWVPIHSALAPTIEALPRVATTLLTNSRGRPWTKDGFRTALAKAWPAEITERCVFHGLRKNAVNSLLEVGCSVPETAAITGQSHQMVEHYAAAVNQRHLARRAMGRLEQKAT